MGSSGTERIRSRSSLLATRGLLAFFVAWGSIDEMKRPWFAPFHLTPSKIAELYPGTKYTWVTWRFEQRGWPLVYLVRTNVPERAASGLRNEDLPLDLACDLAFVGILVFAAWSLVQRWRRQFGLADIFLVTASLAVMLAFQVRAWGHALDYSKAAIDVGVFSATFAIIRCLRKYAARRRSATIATSPLQPCNAGPNPPHTPAASALPLTSEFASLRSDTAHPPPAGDAPACRDSWRYSRR